MFCALAFSALYLIKGGAHFRIPVIGNAAQKPFFRYVFDNRLLSSLLCIPVCIIAGLPEWQAVIVAAAWFVANLPSIGEEIGAIGGYKGNWPSESEEDYVILTKAGGWKKGIQRGVFTGAVLSLFAWNPLIVMAGALFPIIVWCSYSVTQLITGKVRNEEGWVLYEALFGAALGLAFGLGV